MKINIFKDKDWTEINTEDNPAFSYVDKEKKIRGAKSLMIVKVLPYRAKVVGVDGFTVIEVPTQGDVISRGIFWKFQDAELFAWAVKRSSETIPPLKKEEGKTEQPPPAAPKKERPAIDRL